MRARLATLILAAGASLGGCTYGGGLGGLSVGTSYGDPYGAYGGYGSPYGSPYGYGSYGSPYGYAGYGGRYGYDPRFGGYNPYYRSPYYGSPYFGWHDGFYYPGTGRYVYDRERNRREMTERERRHWMQRLAEAAAAAGKDGQTTTKSRSTQSTTGARVAPNWSGFSRQSTARAPSTRVRSANRSEQVERARARIEARQSERRATRAARVERRSSEARPSRRVSDD